jgi:putative flippase GtrA
MGIAMVDWLKEWAAHISDRGGIFMFLRAQFSSQVASLSDFLITVLLANLFKLFYGADEYCLPFVNYCLPLYVYATFIGSIVGGIVNCSINYKWTFKSANEVKKRYVIIKYLSVWVGSIFLNTYGTYMLTDLLGKAMFVQELPSLLKDNVFIISKIVVSLVIGFVWNFNMQRVFVYRNRSFRKFFQKKNTDKTI